MSINYYVRGKLIDTDYWDIDFSRSEPEEYEDMEDYVTDSHGRILGVGRELEL
tara:strand:+ start:958 stop:1116 length:159 start_codon:yes stop_codon:yes gene_type:complete